MKNNEIFIAGSISYLDKSYEADGETYYCFELSVPRKSDKIDKVPVEISNELLDLNSIEDKELVSISGSICSRNTSNDKKKSHLRVFVKADKIKKITDTEMDEIDNNNCINLEGFLCKKNYPRMTHYNREVLDTLLAYNFFDEKGKSRSYYIPCIFWGEAAKEICDKYNLGDKLSIKGRFQSRKYLKKKDDGFDEFVAIEISVQNILKS